MSLTRRQMLAGTAVSAALVPLATLAALPTPAQAAASGAAPALPAWPVLGLRSVGVDVRTAQHLLREMSALDSPTGDRGGLRADGRFGPQTRQAVVAFQRRYELTADGVAVREVQSVAGLPVDGVAGASTWRCVVGRSRG